MLFCAVSLANDNKSQAWEYERERIEENFSELITHSTLLPKWKHPFQAHPFVIGGGLRLSHENISPEEIGEPSQDIEKYLYRLNLIGDWYISKNHRIYTDIAFADSFKKSFNGSRVDVNEASTHQFLYHYLSTNHEVRLGRQEIAQGKKRLFSLREGTNVRRNFHAGLWQSKQHGWSMMLGSPVRTEKGKWDDKTDDSELFLQGKLALKNGFISYIFSRDEKPLAGSGTSYRHTVNWFSDLTFDSWHGNSELFFQWGHVGHQDILASRASIQMFYPLMHQIELKLAGDISTGGQSTNTINTFDSLYMRGDLLSQQSLFTASNLINIQAALIKMMNEDTELGIEISNFWRYDENDSLFNPGRFTAIAPNAKEQFVGATLALFAEIESRHWEVEALLSRLFTTNTNKQHGVVEQTNAELTITFRF